MLKRQAEDQGWLQEKVELWLYPRQAKEYGKSLRLSYNIRGEKRQRREGGIPWQPDWQVATSIHDDHWTAEVRIPLVELSLGEEVGHIFDGAKAVADEVHAMT